VSYITQTSNRACLTAVKQDGVPPFVPVSSVLEGVGIAIRRAFPTNLWVKGEVSDYRPSTAGHHYFNLVERQGDGTQLVLPCAIWKSGWTSVRQKLVAAGMGIVVGQEMLFHGNVRLYDGAGKLTFIVSDVFPEFTLGQIELYRRAVLVRLEHERLIERNKRVLLADIPLRIALVSSRGAAGAKDFLEVLANSGYAFTVKWCEVPVQGANMERTVCRALEILALKQDQLKLDAVCIVRGGGSATDLGWWNNYPICAAIANLPIPVITGIGHDRDRVAVDEVAHTAAPTPTAAAEVLCKAVRAAEGEVEAARTTLRQLAPANLALQADQFSTHRSVVIDRARSVCGEEQRHVDSLRAQVLAHARRPVGALAMRLHHGSRAIQVESSRAVMTLGRTARLVVRQIGLSARERVKATARLITALDRQLQPLTEKQLRAVGRLRLETARDVRDAFVRIRAVGLVDAQNLMSRRHTALSFGVLEAPKFPSSLEVGDNASGVPKCPGAERRHRQARRKTVTQARLIDLLCHRFGGRNLATSSTRIGTCVGGGQQASRWWRGL
jgi:exodeoxyribonuclease VII large subunit